MDLADLKPALEHHGLALEHLGIEVRPPVVEPGATATAINQVEAQLGFSLPESFRRTLQTLARSITWSWNNAGAEGFPAPFHQIFSGGLEWSLDALVEQHRGYLGWVENVFRDSDDEYDTVWHNKLGFSSVSNGDILAVDLAPERSGGIVYLSHDAGEGHGYLMAHSLADLVDRWVPLACPGPEDWQWLPFVRYDFGPIDPACTNGREWRALMGLRAAPPRTAATGPDDQLFDALMATYRASRSSRNGRRAAMRAVKICSTDRADEVLELLNSESMAVQEAAAHRLGEWRWEPAVPQLKRVAVEGTHNGRLAALVALRNMPGDAAAEAIAELRTVLPESTTIPYLGRRDAGG